MDAVKAYFREKYPSVRRKSKGVKPAGGYPGPAFPMIRPFPETRTFPAGRKFFLAVAFPAFR
jgi:hypothetical protein